ncbi:hypothetical protein [Sulfuricurvum sp.]|uniref:hypothetical protein n=1 Tax=Sulfuricurvum sp. TaxID=2025608 RepID=UPI0035662DCF
MLSVFKAIFGGFMWLATFFPRVASWFSSLSKFAMLSSSIRIFLFGLFYSFVILLVTTAAFFFYFMVTNIIKIYNLISFLLDYVSNASAGDDIVNTMFFFLTISGITDGVKAFFPFITTALLFILMKALYRAALFFYMQVIQIADFVIKVP